MHGLWDRHAFGRALSTTLVRRHLLVFFDVPDIIRLLTLVYCRALVIIPGGTHARSVPMGAASVAGGPPAAWLDPVICECAQDPHGISKRLLRGLPLPTTHSVRFLRVMMDVLLCMLPMRLRVATRFGKCVRSELGHDAWRDSGREGEDAGETHKIERLHASKQGEEKRES